MRSGLGIAGLVRAMRKLREYFWRRFVKKFNIQFNYEYNDNDNGHMPICIRDPYTSNAFQLFLCNLEFDIFLDCFCLCS